MILELPKKLKYAGGDVELPSDEPFIKLTAIRDGAMLYTTAGKLVGQVFLDKKGASVTTADASSYRVSVGSGVKIEARTDSAPKYEFFGSAINYNYTIYEYKKGTIKPVEAVAVTTSPITSNIEYKVRLQEEGNIFRALMFVVAINLLIEGDE